MSRRAATTAAVFRCGALAALAAAFLLSGCFLEFDVPQIHVDQRFWYDSQEVLIPFSAYGDGGTAYILYIFEHDPGGGLWQVDEAREVRIPSGSSGVLTYQAGDPAWDYRLTFSLLQSRTGSAVPVPFLTTVHTFRIDPFPPDLGAVIPGIDLAPPSGSSAPGAAPLDVQITVDVFALAPGESPVKLHYTTDGSAPTEHDPSIGNVAEPMRVWDGVSPGTFVNLRMILIDEAGNRSGVLNAFYNAT